jgi:O-antigen ligase
MILYYLFLLLVPFQDHPKLGVELCYLGFVPITPIKIIGILTVAAAFLKAAPEDAARRRPTAVPLLYASFAIFPVFMTVACGLPLPAVSISALISYGLLLVAIRILISTPERLRNTVRVLVLAETIGTLWVFKQYYLLHWPRPHGPSSDENYEALALVMTLAPAVWLAGWEKNRLWRWMSVGAVPLLAFAVFVTQSRGGVFALVLLCIAGWMHCKRKAAMLVVMAVALGVAGILAPAGVWTRFREIRISGQAMSGPAASTRARVELWRAGIYMIEAHPLVGVGLDKFRTEANRYNPRLWPVTHSHYIAHNTYIQDGAEAGLPTLALFLAMLLIGFANCRCVERRAADRVWADLGAAIRLGLLAYVVAAFFLSAQFTKELWLLVFLSQSLREIAMADAQRTGRTPRAGMIRDARSGSAPVRAARSAVRVSNRVWSRTHAWR